MDVGWSSTNQFSLTMPTYSQLKKNQVKKKNLLGLCPVFDVTGGSLDYQHMSSYKL